jgi:hypothetical protein
MGSLVSTHLRRALEIAADIDSKLTASDPRFRGTVLLYLDDGSHFFWDSAFVQSEKTADGHWLMVFTEHHGFHVYAWDDVEGVRAWSELGYVRDPTLKTEETEEET